MTTLQTSKIFRPSIKITSWNIAGPNNDTGPKTEDTDFTATFNGSDIICLQETKGAIELPEYRAFSNLRKTNKTSSGGVVTLISNQLKHVSTKMNALSTLSSDILVVKLRNPSLNSDKDIYIINVYIRPMNSKLKHTKIKGSETFENLNLILEELKDKGEIILCGDFNARIQTSPDYIANDIDHHYYELPSDYMPDNQLPRNSLDKKSKWL